MPYSFADFDWELQTNVFEENTDIINIVKMKISLSYLREDRVFSYFFLNIFFQEFQKGLYGQRLHIMNIHEHESKAYKLICNDSSNSSVWHNGIILPLALTMFGVRIQIMGKNVFWFFFFLKLIRDFEENTGQKL